MNTSIAFDLASFSFAGSGAALLGGLRALPPQVADAMLKAAFKVSPFPSKSLFSGFSFPSTGEVLLNGAKASAAIVYDKLVDWAPTLWRFTVGTLIPTLRWFAVGALATEAVGLLAGALVPATMSWFGVVVPGVGTIHTAGGVAATLQWLSCVLAKPALQAVGGAVATIARALFG